MRSLRVSVVASGVVKALNAVLGLGVAVVLGRALGPEDYGIYSLALVLASVMAILARFGLSNLILRETATANSHGDWPAIKMIWLWASKVTGALVALLVVTTLVVSLSVLEDSPQTQTTLIALVLVPLIAFNAHLAAAIRGLRHIVFSQLPDLLVRPAGMLLLGLTLGTLQPAAPQNAMAGYVFASAAALILAGLILRSITPQGSGLVPRPTPAKRAAWLKSTVSFVAVAGAVQINTYSDILVLGLMRSSEEVGLYRAAFQISLLVSFGIGIATTISAPYFARFKASNDIPQLQRFVTNISRASAAFAILISAIIIPFSHEILSTVFGSDYAASYGALIVLCLTQALNSACGPLGLLLNMTGSEQASARMHVIAAILNTVLNFILIPFFGIEGAATATLITYIYLNFVLWRLTKRSLGVVPSIFGRRPGCKNLMKGPL